MVMPSTVDATVMVNITWTRPNGQQINNIIVNENGRIITNYLFDRAQLGRYTCVAMLIPLSSNSYLRQSISQEGIAQVFTGKVQYNSCSNCIDQFPPCHSYS